MVCVKDGRYQASARMQDIWDPHTLMEWRWGGKSSCPSTLEEFGSFVLFLSYEDAHSDIQGGTGQQKQKPFWWKLQMSGNSAVSCKLNTLLLYNTVTPLPKIHPGEKTTYILERLRHQGHSSRKWPAHHS